MGLGQATFIGYLTTILLGILVIASATSLLFFFYTSSIRREIRNGLEQVTAQVLHSIVKLSEARNSEVCPENYSSFLIGEVNLDLPPSISKRDYEVLLITATPLWQSIKEVTITGENVSLIEKTPSAKIIARTTQEPLEVFERDLPNIGISVQGKIENGKNAKLSYYRYNKNGKIYDKIVLGEASILIDLVGSYALTD